MGKIASTTNKFRAVMVPYVLLKNKCKSIVVGGELSRTPNCVINLWDLEGYEVHSEPTEIIGPKGWLGRPESRMGYVCDETGVTVSFTRDGPKFSENHSAENPDQVIGTPEAEGYKSTDKGETVPYLLLSKNGKALTWGGHIQKKGSILTDGPEKPTYRITGDAVEIVNLATGKTGIGYICDETGVTVTIGREIHVKFPEEIIKKHPELSKVDVTVSFSGVIGILATFDRIPLIFDVGQSKKNFYIGLGVGLFVMFLVRLVF